MFHYSMQRTMWLGSVAPRHDFHFNAGVAFTVGKQHVNSPAAALDPFTLKYIQLSKP